MLVSFDVLQGNRTFIVRAVGGLPSAVLGIPAILKFFCRPIGIRETLSIVLTPPGGGI
jgi:hypothetical protein